MTSPQSDSSIADTSWINALCERFKAVLRDIDAGPVKPTLNAAPRPADGHNSIPREDVEKRLKATYNCICESIAFDDAIQLSYQIGEIWRFETKT